MKQLIFLLLLFCSSISSHSQSIHFLPLSFRDALAKARKENKPLFIEIYTNWCTYCKQMERDVFTTKEAGGYYNEHFINLRYDPTKYDGIQVRKSYTLPGLPGFLYIDPNGLVLLKTAGYQTTEKFVTNADSAVRKREKIFKNEHNK